MKKKTVKLFTGPAPRLPNNLCNAGSVTGVYGTDEGRIQDGPMETGVRRDLDGT